MIYSIFDQEFADQDLVKNQMHYYDIGMKSTLFNIPIFCYWFMNATAQSIVITYFSVYSC